ncbi:MAG: hypothetical protein PUB76_07490 [Oscillospiraceae bacterium]|nr:hypothetical protein [Oscillospiraceae bacterium]
MTLKEKQINSLRKKIKQTQKIINKNTELLKKLKTELETAEINELKSVIIQRGMTVEEIIRSISAETENVVNEKKIEPEIKVENKKITLEDKKDVGF